MNSKPHSVQIPPSTLTLILLSGVSTLPMHLLVPSLPSMAVYFQTDYRIVQLTIALFLALNGAMQLVVGPLSDRYGRRPVLLWGLAIYVAATLGCIFAPDIISFLFFRSLQVGVVVAMVLSRAIIRDLYDQNQAASMIGYVTMGLAVVPLLSPMVGGFIDQSFGWRANVWLMFFSGIFLFALVWFKVGETNQHPTESLRKQFKDYPELFASPRFWGYALTAAFASGMYFSFLGGAPFIGSELFGLSPSVLGAYFGTAAVGYISGNFVTGRWSARMGVNRMILIGSCIAFFGVAASLLCFLAGAGSPQTFFGFMTFVGLGNGMVLPNAIAGSMSVRPRLAGTASGLGGALMIGGGAALSAFTGAMLTPQSGPYPLLYIQNSVGAIAIIVILLVIRRERNLAKLNI